MKRLIVFFVIVLLAWADVRINGGRVIQGAVNYCEDAGGTDAYACAHTPALTAYVTGAHYLFKANTANTGTASINLDTLGAKTIKKLNDQDLDTGCIESGQLVEVVYDSVNMQMLSLCANSGSAAAGLVLVEQQTASASATLDFAACITSTYDTYQFQLVNLIPASDGATINIRVSTDGGSNYVSSSSYSYWDWRYDNATAAAGGSNADTAIVLAETNGVGNASAFGLVGIVHLYDPLSASLHKAFMGNITFRSAAGTRIAHIFNGVYEATTAVNAIRFLASTGNLTSGTVRCYGLAK